MIFRRKRECAPVFVLGSSRSGTSALQLGLLEACGYIGGGEGHIAPLITRLTASVEGFWSASQRAIEQGTEVSKLEKEAVLDGVCQAVRSVYERLYARSDFAEKTPTLDAIRAAPYFHRIWPDAKVIFCHRRGIENVQSKRLKFPGEDFSSLCGEWNSCMLVWQTHRSKLHGFLEIDQLDLASNPRALATRIGGYLGRTERQISRLGDFFQDSYPERSTGSYEPVSLDMMPWTQDEQFAFRRICGPAMKAWSYTFDASYRQAQAAPSGCVSPAGSSA